MENYDNIQNVSASRSFSNQQNDGVTRWRMETARDIERFLKHLEGYDTDDNGKTWNASQTGFKVCGRKGIQLAKSYLYAHINHSVIQGNLSEERYERFLVNLVDDLDQVVGVHYKKYQIERDLRQTYVDQLLGQIMIIMSRAIEDKEREHAVTQSRESIVQRMAEPVKNFFTGSPGQGQHYL